MKKLMLVTFFGIMFAGGCLEQQITPDNVRQLSQTVQDLSESVNDYQQATKKLVGNISNLGITDVNLAAGLETVNRKIDAVQPHIEKIAEAVKTADYSDDDGIVTLLQAAKAGNRASSSVNPYAAYIDVGLTAALAFIGLFARKKSVEAGLYRRKYKAHKEAIEQFRAENPDTSGVLYKMIGQARAAKQIE